MTLGVYTDESSRIINRHMNVERFKGLRYDIVEHKTHLVIRFYDSNIRSFDHDTKLGIAHAWATARDILQGQGIPLLTEKVRDV